MSNVGYATLQIIPSAAGMAPALTKEIVGPAEAAGVEAGAVAGKGIGGGLLGMAKSVAGPLAALFAVDQLVQFTKHSVDAAREQERTMRLTEAVIRSTGGAAGLTAAQIEDLAAKQALLTGNTDTNVQSMENLLLTFPTVRNEIGKGNDIFTQASMTALNMSAALGQDLKSSAIQLGKALGDPAKGMTALQRVGVVFTASERDKIKALEKSGNLMGAQKIILGELTKEFGGAAVAAADPMSRLHTLWDRFQVTIGQHILPLIADAATWLSNVLPAAFDTVSGVVSIFTDNLSANLSPILASIGTILQPVIAAVRDFTSGFQEGDLAGTKFSAAGDAVFQALQKVRAVVGTVIDVFRKDFLPVLEAVAVFVAERVIPVFLQIGAWIATNVLPVVLDLYQALATALVPIFSALADVFVHNVLPALSTLWDVFSKYVLPVLETVGGFVLRVAAGFLEFAIGVLGKVIPPLLRFAGAVLGGIVTALADVIGWVFHAIDAVGGFVQAFVSLPGKILGALGNVGQTLWTAGSNLIGGFIQGVESRASDLINAIKSTITDHLPDFVKKALGIQSPSRVFADLGRWSVLGFAQGIADNAHHAQTAMGAAVKPPASPELATPGGVTGAIASAAAGSQVARLYLDGRQVAEAVFEHGGREAAYGRTTL